MERISKIIIKEFSKKNICGIDYYYVSGTTYEKPFPIQYFPEPNHNLDNCKKCQELHQSYKKYLEEKYKNFPNCCENHKKLNTLSLFDKSDFDNLAKMIADKIIYVFHHIENNILKDNWKLEISNYIEYAIVSFGQIPMNYGNPPSLYEFIEEQINLVNSIKLENEKAKYNYRKQQILNLLNQYLEPQKTAKKDFNLLSSVYERWYKYFPFDLEQFSHLKDKFSKTLPILSEVHTNPYLQEIKVQFVTKSYLLKQLSKITNMILDSIDTTKIINDTTNFNKNKYITEIETSSHRIKQSELLSKFENLEKHYIKTIKTWLNNEKEFIQRLKENSIKNNLGTFEDIVTDVKKQNYIYTMLEDLSITNNGISILSERKKGAIRGIVESLKENSILPNINLDKLCKLIAVNIQLELNSKLDVTNISIEYSKKAKEYIKSNPLH